MNNIVKVSNFLYHQIIKNKEFDTLQKIKIKYGVECIVSELSKIIIYFILFSLFSLTKEFIIAILFFSSFRIYSGGFHQNTYISCFITSFFLLFIIIKLPYLIPFTLKTKIILIIVTYILTYVYSPVDHPNKRIKSKKQKNKIKYISIFVLIILSFISVTLKPIFSNIAISALFIQSITLLVGKIHQENS